MIEWRKLLSHHIIVSLIRITVTWPVLLYHSFRFIFPGRLEMSFTLRFLSNISTFEGFGRTSDWFAGLFRRFYVSRTTRGSHGFGDLPLRFLKFGKIVMAGVGGQMQVSWVLWPAMNRWSYESFIPHLFYVCCVEGSLLYPLGLAVWFIQTV